MASIDNRKMVTRNVTFADGNDSLNDTVFKDGLNAMEEHYSSIELGWYKRTDDELANAIFQVSSTLLNHRPLYLQISKNEFAALLLKALGPDKISSSVVSDIFAEIDIDGDGWLSVDELARYMIKIEQRNSMDMYRFFYDRLTASLLGSLTFLLASSLSISKNLFIRFYDGQHQFTAVAAKLVVWLSLIGSFFFVYTGVHSAVRQLQETESQSLSTKARMLMSNVMTLDQVITAFWVLGSIAYVAERWLAGGVCYFLGGVLAFPVLYRSTLTELRQNQELVCKLHESYPEQLDEADVEVGFDVVQRRLSWQFDDSSNGSDLTEVTKKNEATPSQDGPYLRLHKRLLSDSNAMFPFKDIEIKSLPMQANHRRAPTCPADIFKRASVITCDTGDTESLTNTLCTVTDDQTDDQITAWTSFLGKDIILKAVPKQKAHMPCYDAFVSFSRNEVDLDRSFRVVKRLSQSNLIDITCIRDMAHKKSHRELQKAALLQQFELPALYISIAYTFGGLMFTVGECALGLSPMAIQNIYLTGSCLYFCGSAGVLYRAWLNVKNEWNLLQESRMALHSMTYPDNADAEVEVEHVQWPSPQVTSDEKQNMKNK